MAYVKLLGVFAQGGVVLLNEEPGNFILSEVGVGLISGSGGYS